MRILPRALMICVMVMLLAFSCLADADSGEMTWYSFGGEGGLSADECLERYIDSLFGMGTRGAGMLRGAVSRRESLSEDMKIFYDALRTYIAEVACGQRPSAVFTVAHACSITGDDYYALFNALLYDCPYELYWFDKTASSGISSDGQSTTFYFAVNPEYADTSGDYLVDASLARAAAGSVSNADAIIARYAGSSDYGKLLGYKNEICALVSYNYDALYDQSGADSNAWQLVWVFDGDEGTNVVCEGYAKAFQYLCDKTAFSSSEVYVYCVSGYMDGGAHMWNIVHMEDGEVYLADITNCDSDSIGADDLLFMVGYASGSYADGYIFRCEFGEYYEPPYYDISYEYGDDTKSIYSESELTIADHPYAGGGDAVYVPIDGTTFPDTLFREYVQAFDTDPDGQLSAWEIENVIFINVNGMEIASLEGVGYFTDLMALDCAETDITQLDVSQNTMLVKLVCYGNDISELDVSNNPELLMLECDHCSLDSLDVSGNTLLRVLRCYSNNIHTLDVTENVSLEELVCSDNGLSSLDVTHNTELVKLSCYTNTETSLSGIDVSANTKLAELCLSGNTGIGTLDLGNNPLLEMLWCDYCGLCALDLSANPLIKYLHCDGNDLTELDLSGKTALEYLYCRCLPLGELDVSDTVNLVYLDCNETQLSQLQVGQCTRLEGLDVGNNRLAALDVSGNTQLRELVCYGNELRTLQLGDNSTLESIYCWNNSLTQLDLRGCSALRWFNCRFNQLSSLDLSHCPQLESVDASYNSLIKLRLPEGVADISGWSFSHSFALERVMIPAGVTAIGDTAFEASADDLVICGYSGSYAQEYAQSHGFRFAAVPENILNLPDGLTDIGSEAFTGVAADGIRIPVTVSHIADDALDADIIILAADDSYTAGWGKSHGYIVIDETWG